jgi:hypothetical protein
VEFDFPIRLEDAPRSRLPIFGMPIANLSSQAEQASAPRSFMNC